MGKGISFAMVLGSQSLEKITYYLTNMKLVYKISLIALMFFGCSCAMMFNEKEVSVSINSTPSGADIFIDGKSYGRTPATIKIEPKNYIAVLNKEGYGSTKIQLESWTSMRNGNCAADAMGTMLLLPLYSLYWSGKCDEFKQPEYHAVIPQSFVGKKNSASGNGSMIGIGEKPADMINYYYNQNTYDHNAYGKGEFQQSGQEYYQNRRN
jgi:hypothetical protein